MSHIFTLDDLARSKVCLEFVNQEQPPSIHWKPRAESIPVSSSTRSLSIRVNQSFVNGRPSLTIFLIHDPESIDHTIQQTPDVSDSTTNATPVTTDNTIYSAQENLISVPDSNTANLALFANSPQTVPSASLSFGFPQTYSTEQWAHPDPHSQSEPQSRNSPSSTPYTQMQSLALGTDDGSSALFSSLSSFDMFFGSTHGHDSHEWAEDSSPTASPSNSLQDFGSEGGWSDQSDSPPDSTAITGQKEPAGVNRTRSGARASRRGSGYTSGGVQSRTNGSNKKKRVQCSLCDETFSRRHDMMRHEASQHGKVQQWTCEMCRRFFSSEAMLTVHKCPALRS